MQHVVTLQPPSPSANEWATRKSQQPQKPRGRSKVDQHTIPRNHYVSIPACKLQSSLNFMRWPPLDLQHVIKLNARKEAYRVDPASCGSDVYKIEGLGALACCGELTGERTALRPRDCAMLGCIWARSNGTPGASRGVSQYSMLLVYSELNASSIVDAMWYQPSSLPRIHNRYRATLQITPPYPAPEKCHRQRTACANVLRRCVKCLRIVINQCPLDSQHRTEMSFVVCFSFVLARS